MFKKANFFTVITASLVILSQIFLAFPISGMLVGPDFNSISEEPEDVSSPKLEKGPDWERACINNICTETIYSKNKFIKDQNSEWKKLGEVANVTFDNQVLKISWRDKSIVLDPYLIVNKEFVDEIPSAFEFKISYENLGDFIKIKPQLKFTEGLTEVGFRKINWSDDEVILSFADLEEKGFVVAEDDKLIKISNFDGKIDSNGILELDPTVILQPSVSDTWINTDVTTTNYGTAVNFRTGYKRKYKTLIKFDASSIPSSSTVSSATLSLYSNGWSGAGASLIVETYKILRGWDESTATWVKATSVVNWATGGCDAVTDRDQTAESTKTVNAINTWWDWTVTNMTQAWVTNPANNNGVILIPTDSGDVDNFYYASREASSNNPKLTVIYTTAGSAPIVTSSAATSITANSATLSGNITDTGGENATERGFDWGTTSGTYPNFWTETGSFGTGAFSHGITGLSPGVTYYFRAKAKNAVGWGYGSELSFPTPIVVPTVQTNAATSIGSTSATLNGNITVLGGQNSSERGFDWGTTSGTYPNSWTETGSYGTGAFSRGITGLNPKTTYYFRAKAKNSAGWGFGTELSLPTLATIPGVDTNAATNVSTNSATLNGNIATLGGENATERGFDWGTSVSYSNSWIETGSFGTGAFNRGVTGLSPWTQYNFRAKAKNSAGWGYGGNLTFTTSVVIPTVQTIPATSINSTSVILNGNITNTGGGNDSERGFDWGTSSGVYPNSWTETGSFGIGYFSQKITNLSPATTYYFRVKVKNDAGWGYGSEITVFSGVSIVGTSTSENAVSEPYQRKNFYASGRFWVFYSDGTNMVFRTSKDSLGWGSSTIVRACNSGEKFSIWFDGTYLHYTYSQTGPNVPTYYRRGIPNSDGTITWSAVEQTAVAATTEDYYHPVITVDSNGYPWIGYRKGFVSYPFATKSSKNDGTWQTASGFPYQLETFARADWYVVLVPLTSGKMFAFYSSAGNQIWGKRWVSGSWSASVVTPSAARDFSISAVSQGDDIHLAFTCATPRVAPQPSAGDVVYIKYLYSSHAFETELERIIQVTPDGNLDPKPNLSFNPSNNELYCFWAGIPTANHIYYKKNVGGIWDTNPTDWINESNTISGLEKINTFYNIYGGKIGLSYMTNNECADDIRFNFITLPPFAITNPASDIQPSQATLNGTLSNLGSASSCNVWFQWGFDTSYSNTTSHVIKDSKRSFSDTITGLSSSSTYHFRTVAENNSGIVYGEDKAFTIITSTSSLATANSFQRKTWFDGARYWISFYSAAANRIEFWYSTDGTSWIENASARILVGTNDFSIEADSLYALIVYPEGEDLKARKAASYPSTSFSWGGAVAAFPAISPSIYGSEATFSPSAAFYLSSAVLDSTHFVVTFMDYNNGSKGTAVIGTVSGDTITFGSKYIFNNSAIVYTNVTVLDSTHFVVVYGNQNPAYAYTQACTVSGSSISTCGGGWLFDVLNDYMKVSTLDATHFIIAYPGISSYSGMARLGTMNPSNLSIGFGGLGPYTFCSARTDGISIAGIDSTHFVVTYTDTGVYGEGDELSASKIGTVNLSTGDITFGAENVFYPRSNNGVQYTDMVFLDSTHFVLTYNKSVASNFQGVARICTINLSGSTVSYGNEAIMNQSGQTAFISVAKLDSTHFAAAYQDVSNSNYGTAMIGTVSGSSITYGPGEYIFVFSMPGQYNFDAVGLSSNYFAVSYPGGSRIGDRAKDVPPPDYNIWYDRPTITKDSNNRIWVGARHNSSESSADYNFKVDQASSANDISSWNTGTTLDTSINSNKYGIFVPLASGNVYSIWLDDTSIEGKRYNGSSWDSSATSIASGGGTIVKNISAVADSLGNIHLVYISGGNLKYKEYATSWGTGVTLDSNTTNEYPTISINSQNNDLYVFWERGSHIYYKKGVTPYGLANWDADATDWQKTGINTNVVAGYKDFSSSNVFVEWTKGTAGPYNISFDKLSIITSTLCVDLVANPSSGYSPPGLLDVHLIATVYGTSQGTINYKFDCTNDGLWEFEVNNSSQNPYEAADLCDYLTAGIYIAKAYIERGTLGASDTATAEVVVRERMEARNLSVSEGNYCDISPPPISLYWEYYDPQGYPQDHYQVQIDTDQNFGSPDVDSCNPSPGTCSSGHSSTSYSPNSPPNILSYNTTYYWRVKVWNTQASESDWVIGSSFTTKKCHPTPNFIPTQAMIGVPTQFTDQSSACGGATLALWSWIFEYGTPSSSSEQNPIVTFSTPGAGGQNQVVLTVTDSNGNSCAKTQAVRVSLPLPEWKEVKGF